MEAPERPLRLRAFSGVKPGGRPHLGNYLGAVRRWVRLQGEFESFFCIADLHAITDPHDPEALRRCTREVAAFLVAAGLDPRRSVIFVQSQVPEHVELAWILSCLTPVGWLERMTQYKDRVARAADGRETASAGLFTYPVLMAADILLYRTRVVPVGEDQKQHVELTRDLAARFNTRFGEVFKVPEPLIGTTGARIMGLADPTRKMSKSDSTPGQAIGIFDDADTIRAAIGRATTDSERDLRFDRARPGVNNLLTIYAALSRRSPQEVEEGFAGKGYADLKRDLADLVIQTLAPIQARGRALLASPDLDHLLREGAARAAVAAAPILGRVRRAVGLL